MGKLTKQIKVSEEIKKQLDNLKLVPRETYNEVIKRKIMKCKGE